MTVSDERKREIREKCRIPLFAVGPGTAGLLESEIIGGGGGVGGRGGGGGGGGWMSGCWVEGGEDAGRGEKLVPIIVSRCNNMVMDNEGVQDEALMGRGEEKEGEEKEGEGEEEEGEGEKEEEEEGKKTTDRRRRKKKKKVLWLTGEKRREGLRTGLEGAGIEVDCLIVYSTSVSAHFLPLFTTQALLCKEEKEEEKGRVVRWIIVFSTQGSREILMGLNWLDDKTGRVKKRIIDDDDDDVQVLQRERERENRRRTTFIASIGKTTAGYFEEHFGFTVDVVAERPSPEGVREGIEAFMSQRGLFSL